MDFESAYKKYSDGSANEQEKEFVEQELEKARKMTEIIDRYESIRPTSGECDGELVKKAQKRYAKKSVLRTFAVVAIVFVLAAAIVLSCVFGVAVGSAKSNTNYTQASAEQIALDYVVRNFASDKKAVVASSEKVLEYAPALKNSTYVYEVKIYVGYINELEVKVDSRTGKVLDVDISTI